MNTINLVSDSTGHMFVITEVRSKYIEAEDKDRDKKYSL